MYHSLFTIAIEVCFVVEILREFSGRQSRPVYGTPGGVLFIGATRQRLINFPE